MKTTPLSYDATIARASERTTYWPPRRTTPEAIRPIRCDVVKDGGTTTVWPIFDGVTRERGTGMAFGPGSARIIRRFVACMMAGAAYTNAFIGTDSDGHTYVSYDMKFHGRYMVEGLDALGF